MLMFGKMVKKKKKKMMKKNNEEKEEMNKKSSAPNEKFTANLGGIWRCFLFGTFDGINERSFEISTHGYTEFRMFLQFGGADFLFVFVCYTYCL